MGGDAGNKQPYALLVLDPILATSFAVFNPNIAKPANNQQARKPKTATAYPRIRIAHISKMGDLAKLIIPRLGNWFLRPGCAEDYFPELLQILPDLQRRREGLGQRCNPNKAVLEAVRVHWVFDLSNWDIQLR